ncbi:MAG: copper chaperone PCu(A)C [Myxococcota bacterium]
MGEERSDWRPAGGLAPPITGSQRKERSDCRPAGGLAPPITGSQRKERSDCRPAGGLAPPITGSVLLLALLSGAATPENPIAAERAWSRATPPGAVNGAGYLQLLNRGDKPDRLLRAKSPAAAKVEVHRMSMKDGVMSMAPLPDGVEIPAHGEVSLAPGGVHLMLLGLKEPLVQGASVPVTLEFEHAPPLEVRLSVQGIGAKGPP